MKKIFWVTYFVVFLTWGGTLPVSEAVANVSLVEIEKAVLKEDYQQVQELANGLIANPPDQETVHLAHYYLGLSYLRLGAYQKARDVFEPLTLQRQDPQLRDKAYLGLFDSYYLAEQYQQALEVGHQFLKVSPRSEFLSLIYYKLGRANLKLAQWEKAREYLKKVTLEFPNSAEWHAARQLLEEKRYFAVQLGAFLDRQRAEQLTTELKEKGEYAYIVETVDAKNTKFYRVRVGQLAILDEARLLKSKLAGEGYPTQIYP